MAHWHCDGLSATYSALRMRVMSSRVHIDTLVRVELTLLHSLDMLDVKAL